MDKVFARKLGLNWLTIFVDYFSNVWEALLIVVAGNAETVGPIHAKAQPHRRWKQHGKRGRYHIVLTSPTVVRMTCSLIKGVKKKGQGTKKRYCRNTSHEVDWESGHVNHMCHIKCVFLVFRGFHYIHLQGIWRSNNLLCVEEGGVRGGRGLQKSWVIELVSPLLVGNWHFCQKGFGERR